MRQSDLACRGATVVLQHLNGGGGENYRNKGFLFTASGVDQRTGTVCSVGYVNG